MSRGELEDAELEFGEWTCVPWNQHTKRRRLASAFCLVFFCRTPITQGGYGVVGFFPELFRLGILGVGYLGWDTAHTVPYHHVLWPPPTVSHGEPCQVGAKLSLSDLQVSHECLVVWSSSPFAQLPLELGRGRGHELASSTIRRCGDCPRTLFALPNPLVAVESALH